MFLRIRKRVYLIISQFLSQKNYWNFMGKFSTLDSILDGCVDIDNFFKSGKYTAENFFIKEKLANKKSITLHVGCGIGRVEKYLSKHVFKCFGVDIAQSMIEKAKKNVKAKNAYFYVSDGSTLPFPNKYFDLIYSLFVFQHMPTSLFAENIKEINRTLKRNGKFFFQIPLDEKLVMPKPDKTNPWLMRYYKFSEIKTLLDKNKLKIVKTYSNFENYNGEKFQPNFMVLSAKI